MLSYGPPLVAALSEADRALGELAGLGRTLPNPYLLTRSFLRREAVLSSRIVGTRASLVDLFAFEVKSSLFGELERRDDVQELHIPEELIGHVDTPEPNEIENEMVEAARTNFEENLAKPAVPALTEAKWLERVAFPLGMSEKGDLYYGSTPEGPN